MSILDSYIIKINLADEEIGSISYSYDRTNVKIRWLGVAENYQGKKFGFSLYILMLLHLYHLKIIPESIFLDDCSDWAMTKGSPYYKWGFRILNSNSSPEEMKIVFAKGASYLNSKKAHRYNNGATPDVNIYYDVDDLFKEMDYKLDLVNLAKYRVTVTIGSDTPMEFDYNTVYQTLTTKCAKRQRTSGGASLKPTDKRVQTKWGTRIVYVGKNKKKYVKHNKKIIPLSKLS